MLKFSVQPDMKIQDQRVEALFDDIADLPPESRARILDGALNSSEDSDQGVRAEIERLLRYHDRQGILDHSLFAGEEDHGALPPALEPGEVISGRLLIRRMIGSGGMGEVYEAEELTLGQRVALKTIRPDIASDAEQVERFRRELLTLRAFSHPSVCKVYEYGDIDRGVRGRLCFFTMELLAGETLAERLASAGRLDAASALGILSQTAGALDEIHRQGIIHRDLKPSNIFLLPGPDGSERVVVMDFGLARNLSDDQLRQTRTGMVMGTRLYMAPELSHAAVVASDLYSFGVVAFEMVTGSASPLMAPRMVVPTLDPVWDKALLACFDGDPTKRPASAAEVVDILSRRTHPWRRITLAAAGIAISLGAGVLGWDTVNPASGTAKATSRVTFDSSLSVDPTTSADGKLLAYASDRESVAGDLNIWLRNMETNETRQITDDPGSEDEPALSPDGKTIAWHTSEADALYMKSVSGGSPRLLASHGFAPRFSPDGQMIAYWDGIEGDRSIPARSWIVPVSGGRPRAVAGGFIDARHPTWSRDGKSILFRGIRSGAAVARQPEEWWITGVDGGTPRATGIADRLKTAGILEHESPAVWDGGRVLFSGEAGTGTSLRAIRLLPFFGRAIGAPTEITTGGELQDVPALLQDNGIAYADIQMRYHVFGLDLASDKLTELTSPAALDFLVSSSRDGRTLLFARRATKVRSIWVKNLDTKMEKELKVKGQAKPYISPDGRSAAISLDGSIRLIDIGSGNDTTLCERCGELLGWTHEGVSLMFRETRADGTNAVRTLTPDGKTGATLISAAGLNTVAVSPDGGAIAFTIRTGRYSTISVASVINGTVSGAPAQLTPVDSWADKPVWSADGTAIYFVSRSDGNQCLWVQELDPTRRRAKGASKSVQHFHRAAASLNGLTPSSLGLALGGGSLYFSVALLQSNIWGVR